MSQEEEVRAEAGFEAEAALRGMLDVLFVESRLANASIFLISSEFGGESEGLKMVGCGLGSMVYVVVESRLAV